MRLISVLPTVNGCFPLLNGRPSLLPFEKVLWRKVLDSPEQGLSDQDQGPGSAALGEMLAQEVLDSFHTLTTMPQSMLSGNWGSREASDVGSSSPGTETSTEEGGGIGDGESIAGVPTSAFAMESIAHESLHPLCTSLSYGGHIKVDPKCHGVVVKLDSRSRTSSELLRLQFFSSKEDMVNDCVPLRIMHGHAPERAARARAKKMPFFKIEEADSTSYDTATSSVKDPITQSLERVTLPPALVRQGSTSTTASLGSPTPLVPTGTTRRPVLTSRAMTRAVYEAHNQVVARRKARLKEASAPTSQGSQGSHGSSFRSFALPGVRELWFRFDAPPGAEKPPLQIVSWYGSLDLAQAGKVQADDVPATGPDKRPRADIDEDVSQDEIGLQALFFDEHATDPSLPGEASTKSVKSTDSEDRSKAGDAREEGSTALPGCLATTRDVLLTSGKWFYEATVDSLIGPVGASGEEDSCLVRIGWAHAELGASLHPRGIWTVDEGNLAWDTGAIGGEAVAEEPCTAPDASGGGAQMQGHTIAVLETSSDDAQSGTLMRTVSWCSKSMDSSSPLEEELSPCAGMHSTGLAAPLSSSDGSKGAPLFTETDTADISRVEAGAKSVGFPILGSDTNNLGIGLGEEGFVWMGRRPRCRATSAFAASDVVGCAFDVDSGRAWFSVNGQWKAGGTDVQESTSMMKTAGWGSAGTRIRPCFSVRGKSSLLVNFGSTPFKYPPPGNEFKPVVLRDVHTAREERPRE